MANGQMNGTCCLHVVRIKLVCAMCACSVESPTPSANIPKPVRTLDCVRSEHGHNATIVAAVLAAAVGILHAKQLALQPHARRHVCTLITWLARAARSSRKREQLVSWLRRCWPNSCCPRGDGYACSDASTPGHCWCGCPQQRC